MNFLYTYCLYHCIVTEKGATHLEEKGCKPRMLRSLLTDCSFVCIPGANKTSGKKGKVPGTCSDLHTCKFVRGGFLHCMYL